jgi:hypothetical protein
LAPLVCLAANALSYSAGGGHLWAYLNWALSLRAVGCEVLWLEGVEQRRGAPVALARLRRALEPHGLADRIVLDTTGVDGALPLEAALDADVLLDLAYMPGALARRFRRSVLVDIDPGLTQLWGARGDIDLSGHGLHFTIGEGVAAGIAAVPDCGVRWRYVPPCVALEEWPALSAPDADAAWTTVSHWWEAGTGIELDGEWLDNSKRAGFEPLLDLPAHVQVRLELALGGLDDERERAALQARGWSVRDAWQVTCSADTYRAYVQASRGELSAAKPAYALLRTGWLSDRTVCYLASGRPAVVQDTGELQWLPGEGLLRFSDADDAAAAVSAVEQDYARHSRAARALAQERFDGAKVVGAVLGDALTTPPAIP